MSKNSTLADSVNTNFRIVKDENFKDAIRYKGIASILVKFAIPEFRDMTLVEISRSIIDGTRKHKPNMSDTDILEDEIDFLPTEAGTKDEKNTINDASFRIGLPSGTIIEVKLKCINKEITVNTEMQNVVRERKLGYPLISRAVYYGASLLRDTVPAGDTYYTSIHKVYTVWFCRGNLGLEVPPELPRQYIHRYGLRRFYEGIDQTIPPEKDADLIEIVLVELDKLRKEDSEAANLVYSLFNNTQSVIKDIENKEHVHLTRVRKGVENMIDYEARLEKAVSEAVAARDRQHETGLEGITENYIKHTGLMEKPQDEVIAQTVQVLGIPEHIVLKVYQALKPEIQT